MKIVNAKITEVSLAGGENNHGCLSLWISFQWGASCQSYGGYAMDTYDNSLKRRVGGEYLGRRITDLMYTFGVDDFKSLVGLPARIYYKEDEGAGMGNCIDAIGDFIEERWFTFERGASVTP
jgi:hypothetical protein